MDDLEIANQRMLEKRKNLKANTQGRLTRLSIPTPEQLRERFQSPVRNCRECGANSTSGLCLACEERTEYLRQKQLWQTLRDAKKDNFEAYIASCGVPRAFQNKKEIINESGSVFITGNCGVGKSYTAVSILRGFVKNLSCDNFITPFKNIPIFENVPELLIKIRSCFNSTSKSEEDMLRKYFDTKLLVLDDLGVEKTSEWALQSLYVIINKRGAEEKQTIITSNLTLDEIQGRLSDRIASRIRGMCRTIAMRGKDRRLK